MRLLVSARSASDSDRSCWIWQDFVWHLCASALNVQVVQGDADLPALNASLERHAGPVGQLFERLRQERTDTDQKGYMAAGCQRLGCARRLGKFFTRRKSNARCVAAKDQVRTCLYISSVSGAGSLPTRLTASAPSLATGPTPPAITCPASFLMACILGKRLAALGQNVSLSGARRPAISRKSQTREYLRLLQTNSAPQREQLLLTSTCQKSDNLQRQSGPKQGTGREANSRRRKIH